MELYYYTIRILDQQIYIIYYIIYYLYYYIILFIIYIIITSVNTGAIAPVCTHFLNYINN